jgi:flagellar hook-associated protein 1 FlgK
MTDLLRNGTNSLAAFQRALATTSHNIANVNTEGYSRQRVELSSVEPTRVLNGFIGNGFIGNGVRTDDITRLHDQFAMTQVLHSTSAHAQHDTHLMLASRIDNLVANDALSLTPVMNDFFDAIQDVNGNPTSSATREIFIGSTENVASRLKALQSQLDGAQTEVNQRTNAAIEEVNLLANELAELNLTIASTGLDRNGSHPNDLLDKRDAIIGKISEFTDITTVEQDEGAVNVYIGTGVGLVVGNRANQLRTAEDSLSSNQLKIEFSFGNTWQNITPRLSGGSIGGLLEFESQTLSPSMNQIGLIALQFADSMNAQHAQGVDLNGNLGSDIFTVSEPVAMANDDNTGTGSVTATFVDVSQVHATEYDILYTGSDFTVTRLSDQSQISSNMPITIDGLEFNLSGAPAAGDTFRVSPVRRAAATISSMLTDASSVAFSNPLSSSSNVANRTDATISAPQVTDISNVSLRNPVDIQFTSNTSYDLVDANNGAVLSAGVTYTPGTPISYNGWQADIDGEPSAGDEFSVLANTTAQGDNANGLAMAALQTASVMTGDATFNDSYSAMVSRVGGQTKSLQTRSEALDNLRLDAIERQQSVSGVNLDEEAVNLVRYEQAYQASAQIISTADTLFQTVLSAVAR